MADEIHQEFDDIWRLHRRRALDVAYRMLGSLTEAEDIVQEAFSRLLGQNIDEIDDPERWLVTVTSRLCLDHLRSARIQRESYVGPWLPEPLVQYEGASSDPADRVTLDDTIRMALMIVLDRLTPAERASFILHDVFKIPFEEVGQILISEGEDDTRDAGGEAGHMERAEGERLDHHCWNRREDGGSTSKSDAPVAISSVNAFTGTRITTKRAIAYQGMSRPAQ